MIAVALLVLAVLPRCVVDGLLPDPKCTPGDILPIELEVICSQPTAERRRVEEPVRRAVFAAYGIPWRNRGRYELDHLVPLGAGGSNDQSNLWPEPRDEALRKDRVELEAHRELCAPHAQVSLAWVQESFARDWTALEPKHAASARR